MTVYANIKRPINKGLNTIWSLLTEESSYLRNIKKTYPHHNDVPSLFLHILQTCNIKQSKIMI